ncbi:hypothetical protein BN12_4170006 [Nostocoides japonicum T1-X7]|uniref:Uncharacterized protein n=1 Tax=Nostocoides japonicum T1-X7 TaxID=1194083 RepID=A0A077M2R2_9MICO|nr:hypothetical protein [Tetrasphaera japonica]CCH79357.1 hypothetical protein BN12_4170006 [Tetrasphaera japonica T1-X7]
MGRSPTAGDPSSGVRPEPAARAAIDSCITEPDVTESPVTESAATDPGMTVLVGRPGAVRLTVLRSLAVMDPGGTSWVAGTSYARAAPCASLALMLRSHELPFLTPAQDLSVARTLRQAAWRDPARLGGLLWDLASTPGAAFVSRQVVIDDFDVLDRMSQLVLTDLLHRARARRVTTVVAVRTLLGCPVLDGSGSVLQT